MSERYFFGTAEDLDEELHLVRLALNQWLRTGAKPVNVDALISDLRNRDIKRRNKAEMKTNAQELQELIASTRQKAFEDVVHLINSEAVKHGHNIIDMDAEYLCGLIRSIDKQQ